MAARSQYSGLCETCDREADCTLKRSPLLEIIHCEEFSTQPKMNLQAPDQGTGSPSTVPERPRVVTGRVKRPSLLDPV